jgi:hypothetical protein
MIESAEEFVALRSSGAKSEYDRAAHESASLEVWRDVINSYPDYIEWVVHNKTVPLKILEELSGFDADIRQWVAAKRKLSPELFERLARDRDPQVRIQITVNKKTPLHILEVLCSDADKDVAESAQYFKEYHNSRKASHV